MFSRTSSVVTDPFTDMRARAKAKNRRTLLILGAAALACAALYAAGYVQYFSPAASAGRASDAMATFLTQNHLQTTRASCAADSDGDGYASCTAVTGQGEKIFLLCPSTLMSTTVFGASPCKETDGTLKVLRGR